MCSHVSLNLNELVSPAVGHGKVEIIIEHFLLLRCAKLWAVHPLLLYIVKCLGLLAHTSMLISHSDHRAIIKHTV